MARALGVPSLEIWLATTGSLSAELEPSKTMQNPQIKMPFLFFRSAAASAAITTPALKMHVL